jgi:hypothetical protein
MGTFLSYGPNGHGWAELFWLGWATKDAGHNSIVAQIILYVRIDASGMA